VNNAHVVVGVLPKAPVGTVKATAMKLRAGALAPAALTISAPNDVAQGVSGESKWFTFDVRHALEQTAAGSFAANFPRWEENGCLIKIYDDGDPDNFDVAKVTFGGGEDQIDEITGADHRDLTQIFDALGNSNVWSCLTGYNYVDTGAQATDTLEFTPFLLRGDQQLVDDFLRGASVSVFAVDGAAPLFTIGDAAVLTTLAAGVSAGATTLALASTTGLAANQVAAIEDELVEIVSVDSATDVTVVRGHLGTTAVAHGSGVEFSRGAADDRGIFHCSKVNTTALVVGNVYTVKIDIGYKNKTYTSTHQFTFLLNNV
jgi:hypothetical protein